MHAFFSTAQMFGHVALILSMVSFSRKNDGHFKLWLTSQSVAYASHFFLLGNLAGMAGALLSASRNILSLRTNSLWVAAVLLVVNFALGFFVVKEAWNVIPLIASAVATISMFRLQGLRLRCGMLCATLLWLINNILSGSISGTLMEIIIACISCSTIYRLYRESCQVPVS